MAWFELGRDEGFPTHYADQHNPAKTDILLSGLGAAFLILFFSFVAILPAYTSHKRFLFVLFYTICSLFVGGGILLGNFGHSWEVGQVELKSSYKPASSGEIVGQIGVHIGLRGINITLKAVPDHDSEDLKNEIIDYNEHFSWTWVQGRFGFGPYAGQISRDYRAAVIRGTPTPILQLAEYFTFDGEGIRFGRHYRLAGWYAHFFLWCATVTWVISNILLFMFIRHGGAFLVITGIAQICAALIWVSVRNSIELSVPFESKDGHQEVMLTTSYGLDFYVVLINGVICTCIGVALMVLDAFYPERLCEVFGIDPLSAFDEVVLSMEEQAKELPPSIDGKGTLERFNMLRVDHGTKDASEYATPQVTFRRRKSHGKSHYFNTRRHTQNAHHGV